MAPFTDVERQFQQLVGAVDGFRVDDARDAQIDFGKILDRHLALGTACSGGLGRCGARDTGLKQRSARRLGSFQQRVDLFRLDTREQMRVRRNRRRLFPCVGPDEFAAEAKKIARHTRRRCRQHRCKQHGQQLKALQRLRANRLQRVTTGRILRKQPRLRGIECFIDTVRDAHRIAQDFAVFARCVVRAGRFGLHLRNRQPVGAVVLRLGRRPQFAREILRNEIGRPARDVHVLPDEVAVDARDEVVGIEIEILDLAVELRGEVIAKPFRIESEVEIDIGADARAA